jgi:uncharacterized metal-binding protein YceD (DUF177 family)
LSRFQQRLSLGEIRDGDRIELVADEGARAEIAQRLGLLALDRLEAHVALSRDGDTIEAKGRVKAALDQACVATGDPVRAHVDEAFDLRFIPEPTGTSPDEEVELSDDELDTMFHDGKSIDLAAAVTDSLALALDPYPRSAAADAALREAGVLSEEEASPFAALAALKGKLSGE